MAISKSGYSTKSTRKPKASKGNWTPRYGANSFWKKGPQALGDLVPGLLDPVLQKKAGFTTALLSVWPDLVGEDLASCTMPLKVSWPRSQRNVMDRAQDYSPATLTIACTSSGAMHVQHQSDALIAKVNGFLGYGAIDRLKIVQKTLGLPKSKAPSLQVSQQDVAQAHEKTGHIESDDLRASLDRLGAFIRAEKRK